ncbi:hypothetical protein [Flavobacterium sp. LC2016-01]|uniref:hypothetical protein n=1 Tax=Flavobacterium sp. LC2016-01 TaxID=2675876 RepID=UPI0012BB1D12|nr:hypothetical protein [Flavobacterium sp. LC2016-01]MTH16822.1 hypothetical protein [Flavobacterium sp. LC2016-01]
MTREEFLFHLKGASFMALKFAENYVKDKLATDFKYNLLFTSANMSGDASKFDIYPEDDGSIKSNLTDNEVVDLLYRKNKVPIWIDISVLESNRKNTILHLACAGRYSNNKEDYYYKNDGSAPFGVKSPTLPIGYKEGKKFRLKQCFF